MSALKNSCDTSRVRHAHLPERTATERSAERMANRPAAMARTVEAWDALIARVDPSAPASIRSRDVKRLLRDMWVEQGCEGAERGLLDNGVGRDRASIDRAVVESYLLRFPTQHIAFPALQEASEKVAGRRDWPWHARGENFRLWDEHAGPQRLAIALLATDNPAEVRQAGLDGDMATGAFVRQAVRAACAVAVTHKDAQAIESGERLVALAATIKGAEGIDALLALALLAPWVRSTPTAEHQQRVITLLTSRVGDPRRDADGKWKALAAQLRNDGIEAPFEEAFAILRRWLVQATVREFFAIVAKTTDRRDQWKDRTAFWLGYLDAGYITDAWFAFGGQAEREARRFMKDQSMGFARIEGQGASANQSALLMTIGDVRVAEWSDNGSCRFWPASRPKAPPMYQSVYYGLVLRTMDADRGYEPLPHMGSTWQNRFAKRIYDRTGIEHPHYGRGWG